MIPRSCEIGGGQADYRVEFISFWGDMAHLESHVYLSRERLIDGLRTSSFIKRGLHVLFIDLESGRCYGDIRYTLTGKNPVDILSPDEIEFKAIYREAASFLYSVL
jgi:hypothetical protein